MPRSRPKIWLYASFVTVTAVTTALGQPGASDDSALVLERLWPMSGHDARHTGKTFLPGAQTNNIRWSFQPPSGTFSTDPVVADDGTIYMGDLLQCDIGCIGGNLYAINPNGTLKRTYPLGGAVSTPAISSDGTVYVPVDEFTNMIIALRPSGIQLWSFEPTLPGLGFTPATLAPDGTVYVGRMFECPVSVCNIGAIYALRPDGTLKFRFQTPTDVGSVALGPDGTLYFRSRGQFASRLHAVTPQGTEKWSIPNVSGFTSPVVGFGGIIYAAAGGRVFAINPNGTEKWQLPVGFGDINALSLGWDGTIYAAVSDAFGLYAVNPDGTLKWVYKDAANPSTGMGSVHVAPSISGDGIVYVHSAINNPARGFYAVNSDGTLKWRRDISGNLAVIYPRLR